MATDKLIKAITTIESDDDLEQAETTLTNIKPRTLFIRDKIEYLRVLRQSRSSEQTASYMTPADGITDVKALMGVHTLDLSRCPGITDVGCLGGVHTLYLSWCPGVTDVTALGGVHTLDLSGCYGITDVGALGSVHTLDLSCCGGITEVGALGRMRSLQF